VTHSDLRVPDATHTPSSDSRHAATPKSLRGLAEALLEFPGALSPSECELLAATIVGLDSPCQSDRLRMLMGIACLASVHPARLLPEDAVLALRAGASSREVQDATLIGAAFWILT
jgi:hypothetical protein